MHNGGFENSGVLVQSFMSYFKDFQVECAQRTAAYEQQFGSLA
jgi:hypothetical protein